MRNQFSLVLFFSIGCLFTSKGQTDLKIDSLFLALESQPLDTHRVNTLLALSRRFLQLGKQSEAMLNLNEALILSKNLGFSKGIGRAYRGVGNTYLAQYNYTEAMSNFKNSLKTFENILDNEGIGAAYYNIGFIHFRQDDYKEALLNFQEAVNFLRQTKSTFLTASLSMIGNIYLKYGDNLNALKFGNESLQFAEKIEDGKAIVHALTLIGTVLSNHGKDTEAIEQLKRAISISHKMDLKQELSIAHMELGTVYARNRNFIEALRHYKDALDISSMIGNTGLSAGIMVNIGNIYGNQGNYKEGINYYQKASEIAAKLKMRGLAAACKENIGGYYYELNNLEEALKHYLSSLALYQELEVKGDEASCLLNIGSVYSDQGNFKAAMVHYKSSLSIAETLKDKNLISKTKSKIGAVYLVQGSLEEANSVFEHSMSIAAEINDTEGVADGLRNIADMYNTSGLYTQAMEYYTASFDLFSRIDNKLSQVDILIKKGHILIALGKYTEAMKNALNSLKILQSIDGPQCLSCLASNHTLIGSIYLNQNNFIEAIKSFETSLEINKEIGRKPSIADDYADLARVYYHQKIYDKSLEYFQQALNIHLETGSIRGLARCKNNLGKVWYELEKYDEALEQNTDALKLYEEAFDKDGQSFANYFCGLACMKLTKNDEALRYLNKSLQLSSDIGLIENVKNSHEALGQLHYSLGNFKEAADHHKVYYHYKDSMLLESNSNILAELQIQYETDRKDKEIELLHSQQLISKLETDKLKNINLLNLQELDLVKSESEKQQILLDKKLAEVDAHENALKLKEAEVQLLNKEKTLQNEIIKNQKQVKKYTFWGILLLTFLAAFAYKNHNTRQKLKLQSLRNKISTDLHDDVGSTLSSIYMFSEMAKEQSSEVMPMLNTIGESSKKMLDAMADIVWTINPENDQFEKIIERMQIFAFELLGAKKIDFEFETGDNLHQLKLPMDVRKNLYLIFKEATNNLVKYAAADKAHFSIREENKQLTMIIQDNGKGFDPASSSQGNGLKNMKKRAEEIGGKLSVVSKKEQGTTITLSVAV